MGAPTDETNKRPKRKRNPTPKVGPAAKVAKNGAPTAQPPAVGTKVNVCSRISTGPGGEGTVTDVNARHIVVTYPVAGGRDKILPKHYHLVTIIKETPEPAMPNTQVATDGNNVEISATSTYVKEEYATKDGVKESTGAAMPNAPVATDGNNCGGPVTPDQCTVGAADAGGQRRAELHGLSKLELKIAATDIGVHADVIDDAADNIDEKTALVEIIVAAEEKNNTNAAAKALNGLTIRALKTEARKLVDVKAVFAASETADEKKALIDLILMAKGTTTQTATAVQPDTKRQKTTGASDDEDPTAKTLHLESTPAQGQTAPTMHEPEQERTAMPKPPAATKQAQPQQLLHDSVEAEEEFCSSFDSFEDSGWKETDLREAMADSPKSAPEQKLGGPETVKQMADRIKHSQIATQERERQLAKDKEDAAKKKQAHEDAVALEAVLRFRRQQKCLEAKRLTSYLLVAKNELEHAEDMLKHNGKRSWATAGGEIAVRVRPQLPSLHHHQRKQFPVMLCFAMTINKPQSADTLRAPAGTSQNCRNRLHHPAGQLRGNTEEQCVYGKAGTGVIQGRPRRLSQQTEHSTIGAAQQCHTAAANAYIEMDS